MSSKPGDNLYRFKKSWFNPKPASKFHGKFLQLQESSCSGAGVRGYISIGVDEPAQCEVILTIQNRWLGGVFNPFEKY